MCKAYCGVISQTKEQSKYGTKLMLFMLDKEMEKKVESVKKRYENYFENKHSYQ